jgi:hypothetical protein
VLVSGVRPRLADLRVELSRIRRERARLDAAEASIIRAMDAISQDPDHPDFAVADAELVRAGLSQRDANRVITRSAVLGEMPGFDSALAEGRLTAGHVDALASGLGRLSETDKPTLIARHEMLVRSAESMTVDEFTKHMKVAVARAQSDGGLARFEKQRRSTYLRTWNDPDGMIHLRGAFDPERGSILLSRLDQRVEAMFHSGDRELPVEVMPGIEPNDHRRALALVDLVTRPDVENAHDGFGLSTRRRAHRFVSRQHDARSSWSTGRWGRHAIVSTRTIRPSPRRATAEDSGPETIAGGPLDTVDTTKSAGRMPSTGRRSVGCCLPGLCGEVRPHSAPSPRSLGGWRADRHEQFGSLV